MTRSYLIYVGPGDLRVEMGLCTAVPSVGQRIEVDGVWFLVDAVEWAVYTTGDNPERHPADYYPQQCATVRLAKRDARATRRSR